MKSMYLFFIFFARFYFVDVWVNSYAKTIYPVGNKDDWVVSDDIKQTKILKPTYRPKVGLPKANRRPSQGEKKKALPHYSSCERQGHNCSTCKYIIPAPSTVSGSGSRIAQQD